MSTTITRKKDTGEQGNGGQFGSVTRSDAQVAVPGAASPSTLKERLHAKTIESNAAFERYEALAAEMSELTFESLSRDAAGDAPSDAVAIGIASEPDDDPERPEDSLRGVRWIHADGSVHHLDDDITDHYYDQWCQVDRGVIRYTPLDGLIDRNDSGLPDAEMKIEDVEFVIPIRGRAHGMQEPQTWV